MFSSVQEAISAYAAHAPIHAMRGVHALDSVQGYVTDAMKRDYRIALDAQPGLSTNPSGSIPWFLTNLMDPQVYKVLFSPNKAAEIVGEVQKGSWLDTTAMFPIAESAGETTAYGDYATGGLATVNVNWPTRQSFLFQIIKQYGEKELEQAGLGRINWVSELDISAALQLNKYSNLTYFFGVGNGLENYGLLNDPGLAAPIAPAPKAYGGSAWVSGGVVVATANEIFADIQSLFLLLVNQSNGIISAESPMTIGLSPASKMALTATNSFNVNVEDLLKKNFPSIKIVDAVQYGTLTASNPQGLAGGNYVQMICNEVEGQKTAYAAYNEKQRAHKIIPGLSSFMQKVTAGTWGTVIRQPWAIAGMQGV